jgi:hypothetical protein
MYNNESKKTHKKIHIKTQKKKPNDLVNYTTNNNLIINKINDKLNLEAAKLISENKKNEAAEIYIYLVNNGYNKINIINWLVAYSINNYNNYLYNKYKNEITNKNKLKYLINIFFNKEKVNFDLFTNNNYNTLLEDINELYNNDEILKEIDLFNFFYTVNFNNPLLFKYLNKIYYNINPTNYIKKYKHNNNFSNNIGIYCLHNQSPAFKNCFEVLYYLSLKINIILYLECLETEFDIKYKDFLNINSNHNIQIIFIKDESDNKVINLMKNNNHKLLLFINGFYLRKNIVLEHPAFKIINYLELPSIYNNTIYDYNLIDKYAYNIIKSKNKNIDNDYNFILLDIPYIMSPYCCNFNNIEPIYNQDKIEIGLISNGNAKICDKIIFIVNQILEKNKNIFLNIYTYCENEWLLKHFFKYKNRIKIKSYNNNNYMNELQENLLYLDTIIYNGHSTAMEIFASKRPLICYKNTSKYFGSISSTMIEYLGLLDELCADNVNDYINIILHHLENKENYYKMYTKFINKINETGFTNNKIYTDNLYEKLNEILVK